MRSDMRWEILSRYLSGQASPDDRARVEAWIRQAPDRRSGLAELEARWNAIASVSSAPPAVDAEDAWRTFQQRMQQAGDVSKAQPRNHTRLHTHLHTRRWAMTAFAALAIALGGLSLWRVSSASRDNVQVVHTNVGEQRSIRLADGSSVLLAPATTVWLRQSAATVRGEAYFTIAPHADHAYTVQTTNALVRVLGTRFTVRQYQDERTSRVVVEEGRVSLQALRSQESGDPIPTGRAVLSVGMLGQVRDSATVVTPGISTDRYTGWTNGLLVFDVVPMQEIVADLARAYGVEIRIADSTLAREPVSITVSVKRQSLSEVLGLLGPVVDAHYTRVGNAFVVVPGRVTVQPARPKPNMSLETQYGK